MAPVGSLGIYRVIEVIYSDRGSPVLFQKRSYILSAWYCILVRLVNSSFAFDGTDHHMNNVSKSNIPKSSFRYTSNGDLFIMKVVIVTWSELLYRSEIVYLIK